MPGPFAVSDTIVTPILTQLANRVNAQIVPPPTAVYIIPPEGNPDDNTLALGCSGGEVVNSGDEYTNAILGLHLNVNAIHFIRSTGNVSDDTTAVFSWLSAYLNVFSAWANQNLMDSSNVPHSRTVDVEKFKFIKTSFGDIPYYIIFMTVLVKADLPIPLN